MIEVRFFKTKGLVGWLVRWFTWSKWNHVDINIDGTYYAAQEGKGVFRNDGKVENVLDMDTIQILDTARNKQHLETFLKYQLDKEYDWHGILGFILRKGIDNKDKWFCSELIATALNKIGYQFPEPFKVSPGSLFKMLDASNNHLYK